MLYDISKENKKIYNLLHDQDATIQLQSKAIEYQSIYIKQMEYRVMHIKNALIDVLSR